MSADQRRERLIQAVLSWNEAAGSDGFSILIPNTSPALYIAFGTAETIGSLVGPRQIVGEDGIWAANDAGA